MPMPLLQYPVLSVNVFQQLTPYEELRACLYLWDGIQRNGEFSLEENVGTSQLDIHQGKHGMQILVDEKLI